MRISNVLLILLCALSTSAFSQSKERVASESRDAAVGYIGTMNFIVGRIGRDCLTVLERTETPQQFAGSWQQRNAKYIVAVEKYMQRRLDEALAEGGEKKRDAVLRDVTSVASTNGEATVRSWLESGDKQTACKRAVLLVDNEAMDITLRSPMFSDIQALLDWSEHQ
jgi:hypothetical protein